MTKDELARAKRDGMWVMVLTLPKTLLALTGVVALGGYGVSILLVMWFQWVYAEWIATRALPVAIAATFVYFIGLAVMTVQARPEE